MVSPDKTTPYSIHPIPAFADNYLWCLSHTSTDKAYVIDPGDGQTVLDYLQQQQLSLAGILITHHHYDHTDGIPALLSSYPDIAVLGPKNSPCIWINKPLVEGDGFTILGINFTVMEVPGHTLDHIAYYSEGQALLFCGDTLFRGGCGRVFEGTMAQMHQSLDKLAQLPAHTQACPTHEYTLDNLAFAHAVEPNNQAIIDALESCDKLRRKGIPTLPTTISHEQATNPFLRCQIPSVIAAANQHANANLTTQAQVFACLREWKNNF